MYRCGTCKLEITYHEAKDRLDDPCLAWGKDYCLGTMKRVWAANINRENIRAR
jgi:hypothetical protein